MKSWRNDIKYLLYETNGEFNTCKSCLTPNQNHGFHVFDDCLALSVLWKWVVLVRGISTKSLCKRIYSNRTNNKLNYKPMSTKHANLAQPFRQYVKYSRVGLSPMWLISEWGMPTLLRQRVAARRLQGGKIRTESGLALLTSLPTQCEHWPVVFINQSRPDSYHTPIPSPL